MNLIHKLASVSGRRDEIPNQELAKAIALANDHNAISELVALLQHTDKAIQSDSIKVIYEIGALNPKLVARHHAALAQLLDSKNNRLQWGAMTALGTIALEKPEFIFEQLPKLVEVAEKGSVITKDHLMAILIKLYALPQYATAIFALFNEQLLQCATNQLPMYAEQMLPKIGAEHKIQFIQTLTSRLGDIEKETKRKRVEKVIQKLAKQH
ncbi:hypothetical protein [Flavobacterium sp.]|uniref:hypothetical protein n=1 Tax=Flavobacterium sp. TaxID=239 RepID=UPI0039E3ADBC